jgi:hypothetical protein
MLQSDPIGLRGKIGKIKPNNLGIRQQDYTSFGDR